MANQDHLKILDRGIPIWDQWRKDSPNIIPDLESANLTHKNLKHANLKGANLSKSYLNESILICTDLTGANLSNANLDAVNLTGADLSHAILHDCNLVDSNLTHANLFHTDFQRANLSRANLHAAILEGTNLNNANVLEVNFTDIDLSKTKGLEKLKAYGHSTIDHRTLMLSKKLPEKFLRDCGLPEQFIDNLPSLINSLEPIQFHSVFISYSSEDEEFAKRLYTDLRASNVNCWFAPEDIKVGDKIRTRIDEAIQVHDKLLLVLSKDSVNSNWVEKEVETAFEKEKERKTTVLFPIRLDDTVMDKKIGWSADIKRTRQIGDFGKWKDLDFYQKSYSRLLRDLKFDGS